MNQWTSHSRDMVESFKRYYNNSFLDRQRQEAYNLFLGNYIYDQGQPMLWDLSTDYYLHHADPRSWAPNKSKSYVEWFTPAHLKPPEIPKSCSPRSSPGHKPLQFFDDYWLEYYRPLAISAFEKILSYKMISTNLKWRYMPFKSTQESKYDLSPFRVRSAEPEMPEKPRSRKEVVILDPQDARPGGEVFKSVEPASPGKQKALSNWLHSQLIDRVPLEKRISNDPMPILNDPLYLSSKPSGDKPRKDKSAMTQWTLNQFVNSSLNPTVADSEAHEYQRYINHPLHLPLVVSTDVPANANSDFFDYTNSLSLGAVTNLGSTEDDVAEYLEFLAVADDPLTVTDADTSKKRYKAYRQWLKGKSLFKQQRIDP